MSIDSLLTTVTEPPLASRIMTYNNVGRLSEIIQNGTTVAVYTHNAMGLRTRKVTAGGTTVYHYDLAGQLISETQADGTPIRDYLWDGMQPAVQIDNTNGQERVSYLHTDHLMTPRFATDQQGNVVWRWEGQAFGNTQASGSVTVNLRFPGQYFDEETGLHYNWFRYYEPVIGRYVRSDPIGLDGGLNTFGYVNANPLNLFDFNGLVITGTGTPSPGKTGGGWIERPYKAPPTAADKIVSYIADKIVSNTIGLGGLVTGSRLSAAGSLFYCETLNKDEDEELLKNRNFHCEFTGNYCENVTDTKMPIMQPIHFDIRMKY